MEKELYERSKDLQGEEFLELKAQEQKKIDEKKRDHEITMTDTHVRMFNIEALLNVVKEKTSKLSVCGLVGPKDKLDDKKNETRRLFNIPEKSTQYVLHSHINKKTLLDQVNNKLISSVWTF